MVIVSTIRADLMSDENAEKQIELVEVDLA